MRVKRWTAYISGGVGKAKPSRTGGWVRYADHEAAVADAYQRGYTAGYNDHARAAQHWQDTHGAYRQHGQGENP